MKLDKSINEQLTKAYKLLDDVRAKLENIGDEIATNELYDELHSDLSESIQDWLGPIHALDCNMAEFVTDEN